MKDAFEECNNFPIAAHAAARPQWLSTGLEI
jgi:hypothetical protein